MFSFSWCPPGGAVGYRAADLRSAEETRGYRHSQETRGKYIYDTHVIISNVLSICSHTHVDPNTHNWSICVCFRPWGRTWRGRWRERENFSWDTESCWWREKRWSTALRNTEQHKNHTFMLHSNPPHGDVEIKLTAAARNTNQFIAPFLRFVALNLSVIFHVRSNSRVKPRLRVLMLLWCHQLSFEHPQ